MHATCPNWEKVYPGLSRSEQGHRQILIHQVTVYQCVINVFALSLLVYLG